MIPEGPTERRHAGRPGHPGPAIELGELVDQVARVADQGQDQKQAFPNANNGT